MEMENVLWVGYWGVRSGKPETRALCRLYVQKVEVPVLYAITDAKAMDKSTEWVGG